MSNKDKGIDIKNHACYFFDDIINIKNLNKNNTKIDEKSYKKCSYLLYWVCDDQRFEICKINSINRLYLIISKVNGYFEEVNGNKYSFYH